jgi:hypothetical protein
MAGGAVEVGMGRVKNVLVLVRVELILIEFC